MKIVECILLLLLLVTGIAAPLQKHPLIMVISFTTFGLLMSVIWMLLRAPDLAITEAAVGTGVSGVLFYLTLRRIRQMQGTEDEKGTPPLSSAAGSTGTPPSPSGSAMPTEKSGRKGSVRPRPAIGPGSTVF